MVIKMLTARAGRILDRSKDFVPFSEGFLEFQLAHASPTKLRDGTCRYPFLDCRLQVMYRIEHERFLVTIHDSGNVDLPTMAQRDIAGQEVKTLP